jgi:hypothetical protein
VSWATDGTVLPADVESTGPLPVEFS